MYKWKYGGIVSIKTVSVQEMAALHIEYAHEQAEAKK